VRGLCCNIYAQLESISSTVLRIGHIFAAGGQTRSAPARPSPSPRQSYSRPIFSAPPIQTHHNEYYTTIPLTAPAPNHYMGPVTGFGLGSSSLFFIAFCMGCASMIAVNGFLSEKTFGGSLRGGTQTSTVLKLQVTHTPIPVIFLV
jgi:hypothetical protein